METLKKRRNQKGFTLIELMIVVAIIGLLSALAIYGVMRYLKNSKTAEARLNVGQIAKLQSAAYAKPKSDGESIALGSMGAGTTHELCDGASASVPTTLAQVKGAKYQSQPSEWTSDEGWNCLKFSMESPQYYQYTYAASAAKSDVGSAFRAGANGDLAGSGATDSVVWMGGTIKQEAGGDIILSLDDGLNESELASDETASGAL